MMKPKKNLTLQTYSNTPLNLVNQLKIVKVRCLIYTACTGSMGRQHGQAAWTVGHSAE